MLVSKQLLSFVDNIGIFFISNLEFVLKEIINKLITQKYRSWEINVYENSLGFQYKDKEGNTPMTGKSHYAMYRG